jgi:tRNA-2-methylthio-N6-dimethylallyladenosine synthase
MPYLHLPVQSGSDAILEAMNRRHTVSDYLRVVDRLRAVCPDLALSSDFIVGFPGESDADFEATLKLIRRVNFSQAYSFKYSPRPGTPASLLPQVDERVKNERLTVLQDLLARQQRAFNERFVGSDLPVLFEREGRKSGQLLGRSPYMQAVHAPGPHRLIGTIAAVRIVEGSANSLGGTLAEEAIR